MRLSDKHMHHILKSFSKEIEKRSGYLTAAKKPLMKRLHGAANDTIKAGLVTGAAGAALLGYGAVKYRPMD
jgi:type II secretory pathway predicted ATPase ExeA